ncbi:MULTISPECIES: META domain-containing protein [Aequorivita]|uniref:META domain-containing protein n=1 Tax=Aequorivita iocasae TaxID=2803865 RepID=A0ABX7DUW9_9FLAO|nr:MULTISPECIES: META domain-containing protein [Aequorivita]QQX77431.1 META domain-containing protein [Aequorivita iocasae]UCA56922.1 META domain-containing protein [Aequorivita sp. F7]
MKALATVSILLFVIIFTGCDETKKVIDVAGSVQLTGSYTVNSINGKKLENTKNPTFTLSAIDNSFRGTTGCNSVFGNYTIDLYSINFGDLAVSEKMCMDKNIMNTERDFLNALNNTGTYGLQNGVLTLYSKTDRSVLLSATKDSNE